MPEVAAKDILIVDDDKQFCQLLAPAFEAAGYKTAWTLDGQAALDLFKKRNPPIVLLDVAMPGLNGFQVAEQIRKLEPKDTHTLIVIMTAHTRSFTITQEFEIGIDSYLSKPMLPDDIVAHVSSLIE